MKKVTEMQKITIRLVALAVLLTTTLTMSAKDYSMTLFGIKSDGTTMNTRSIQRASTTSPPRAAAASSSPWDAISREASI